MCELSFLYVMCVGMRDRDKKEKESECVCVCVLGGVSLATYCMLHEEINASLAAISA